ncbi:MAG: FKBP-type peptidyl-prolyl cis-trans isomerase [Chlamydiia bacterium]|nr:FKBP-type peptidyl-prolyl cis-trans isomerase [Chlamydiia bacterium]
MKTVAKSLLVTVGLFFLPLGAEEATQNDKQEMIELSEAFGHFIGKNLQTTGIDFNLDAFIQGIRNGAEGKPAPMSDQEYEKRMSQQQEKAFKHLSEENLEKAENYLKDNVKNSNVRELEPGKLQVMILQEGNGDAVAEGNVPMIHYTGKFVDGEVFGSSEDSNNPISIPLNQTIPGFSKGLIGMKEGERRRIFVHPDLGYGTAGHLPPNSLLIFDVELVKANNDEMSEDEEEPDLDDAE